MLQAKRFCGCLSLETGLLFYGYFCTVICVIGVDLNIMLLMLGGNQKPWTMSDEEYCTKLIISLVVFLLAVIVSVMFVMAIHRVRIRAFVKQIYNVYV